MGEYISYYSIKKLSMIQLGEKYSTIFSLKSVLGMKLFRIYKSVQKKPIVSSTWEKCI